MQYSFDGNEAVNKDADIGKKRPAKPFWRSKLENMLLYKKMIVSLILTFSALLLIFFLALKVMLTQYDRTLYQTNAALLKNLITTLEEKYSDLERLSYRALSDPEIQNNLYKMKNAREPFEISAYRKNLYEKLTMFNFSNPYIESTHLVIKGQNHISLGDSEIFSSLYKHKHALQSACEQADGKETWYYTAGRPTVLVLGRQILQMRHLRLGELGQLYFMIDLKRLITDSLNETGFYKAGAEFLLLNQKKIVFPAQVKEDLTKIHLTKSYAILSLEGKTKFVTGDRSSRFGWSCLYLQDYDQIFHEVKFVSAVSLLAVLFLSLALWFFLRRQLKKFFRHLDYLVMKIQHFGKTEEDLPQLYDYSERKDEIGMVHQYFDEMTERVRRLRNENFEKQILLKDTQIHMLQLQINPHFLYNTLDTINWIALQKHVDEIAQISQALARLFRISVKENADLIPFKQELAILDNYLTIQKIRFGDSFDFVRILDSEPEGLLVPKLCLQPLVENALKHALEHTAEACTIYLETQNQADCFVIIVSNTGSQFKEEIIEKLRHPGTVPPGSGIGLINIDARMRLLFGEAYHVEIYNEDEKATIKLRIPKQRADSADE